MYISAATKTAFCRMSSAESGGGLPTGVFTDKTFKRHYTRKWDLQTSPSICVHCGTGCNIIPGERYGALRRIRNRYHDEVNGYFLCDRGRFGYEFVNHSRRIRHPFLSRRAEKIIGPPTGARDERRPVKISVSSPALRRQGPGIGSPTASLEANYALRTLVGPEHFFSGLAETGSGSADGDYENPSFGPGRIRPLCATWRCRTRVLVLGEDLINTAPMMALALNQAVKEQTHGKGQEPGDPSME